MESMHIEKNNLPWCMLLFNSILRACILLAANTCFLNAYTTISVIRNYSVSSAHIVLRSFGVLGR